MRFLNGNGESDDKLTEQEQVRGLAGNRFYIPERDAMNDPGFYVKQ